MSAPTERQRLEPRERPTGQGPVMYQKWRDLLFLHWEFDPGEIQRTIPRGLTVDTFEGCAYVAIVPFFMRDIRVRFLPPIPGTAHFLEMNVRTYVCDASGTPGVWFYSLEANPWLAVQVARRFFFLPYFHASMSATRKDGFIEYACNRKGTASGFGASFAYRAGEEVGRAQPGTLEFFLIERYILFALDKRRGRLYSGQVHHPPYPLHRAEVKRYSERPLELAGLARPGRRPDHIILSKGVDVEVFALERVNGS